MDHSAHNKLVSFIWNIADDVLRDVYVRGKYRDVILPMADETVVLPGHGPSTTIGRERAGNPYLQDLPSAPPARGL